MLRSNPSAGVGAKWMGTRCKLRLGFRSLDHPFGFNAVNLGVWGRAPTLRGEAPKLIFLSGQWQLFCYRPNKSG